MKRLPVLTPPPPIQNTYAIAHITESYFGTAQKLQTTLSALSSITVPFSFKGITLRRYFNHHNIENAIGNPEDLDISGMANTMYIHMLLGLHTDLTY